MRREENRKQRRPKCHVDFSVEAFCVDWVSVVLCLCAGQNVSRNILGTIFRFLGIK